MNIDKRIEDLEKHLYGEDVSEIDVKDRIRRLVSEMRRANENVTADEIEREYLIRFKKH